MKNRKKAETIIHPFPAFYQKDSRILILGSFPSVKSREENFFYGHPQNRFWKLLPMIYQEGPLNTKAEKIEFLKRHNIALWDVIHSCTIIGSSDSSIQNVVPNELHEITKNAPIQKIICNGNTSYKYYIKYQEKFLSRKAVVLPSTSPANAKYSLQKLHFLWKKELFF